MEQINARQIVIFVTGIAILAVIGLGLVLRNATNTSIQGQDLVTMAQGLQKAFVNSSYNYGTGTIPSSLLINGGKVDPTIVSGTTIVTRWQQTITFTGNTTFPSASLPAVPNNACEDLMLDATLAQYVTSIGITGGTMRTEPVSQTNAATDCGASGTVNLTVNFQGHP